VSHLVLSRKQTNLVKLTPCRPRETPRQAGPLEHPPAHLKYSGLSRAVAHHKPRTTPPYALQPTRAGPLTWPLSRDEMVRPAMTLALSTLHKLDLLHLDHVLILHHI
jgi:hypothetical protein